MRKYKAAFTLLEVLVSILLLSLIMVGLNKVIEQIRISNKYIFKNTMKALSQEKVIKLLYNDILQSNGIIDIISKDKDMYRLIIYNTTNSLYGLFNVKVAWLVDKYKNRLLRVENGDFSLPLKLEENVAIDATLKNIELFTCYKSKEKNQILLTIKVKGTDPKVLLINNIYTSTKNSDKKNSLLTKI